MSNWYRHYQNILENALDVPTPTVEDLAKKYGVSTSEVEKQVQRGIKVEKEHTTHESVAREIALDHLGEKLDYYELLAKVEEDVITEGRASQWFRMPVEFSELIKSWPTKSQSPYSNSFYNLPSGEKTWNNTPEGSLRVSDHWNFKTKGSSKIHCPTDIPVSNQAWALGQWNKDHYKILKTLPKRNIWDLSDDEAKGLSPEQQIARTNIIKHRSKQP